MDEYLSGKNFLEIRENTWKNAAGIRFELRRKGITVSSPVDCCIARMAMDEKAFLRLRDQDFDKIGRIRSFSILWFEVI